MAGTTPVSVGEKARIARLSLSPAPLLKRIESGLPLAALTKARKLPLLSAVVETETEFAVLVMVTRLPPATAPAKPCTSDIPVASGGPAKINCSFGRVGDEALAVMPK